MSKKIIRRKKIFLLLLAVGCVFHFLRGSEGSTEKELLDEEKQKGKLNAKERRFSPDSNAGKGETDKKEEWKESEFNADNEGEEKEKETGWELLDDIGKEDQRDKVGAISGSFDKENHERTETEDKTGDVEHNRNVTVIPKQGEDIQSERGVGTKSPIKESFFHADNQSNKYPSHDDDRIAYQVHLNIIYFWHPITWEN